MSRSAKRTHLYEIHNKEANMALFAGFEMPMWFKGIISEHMAVRNTVGIFDITHMGRTVVTGPEAEAFLNYVTTNDVSSLAPLSAHYSAMCNRQGGIKDDFVLSRLESEEFLIVYNAANREKDYEWLLKQSKEYDAEVEDVSDSVSMFAVQGPKAEDTLHRISEEDLSRIKRFKCGWMKIAGFRCFISRTGYTGEDGFELLVWNTSTSSPDKAVKVWNTILKAGREEAIEPCGLGARDTLRLEAGMCLYDNDIDEGTSPLEARLSFAVKLEKGDFIGRDALLRQKEEGVERKRVGIHMLKSGIPRPDCEVWKNGEKIGRVTSGTFSPVLKCGIAMAYVSTEHVKTGETVAIKIRDKLVDGEIVKFPFYDPTEYGYKRKI
ncbi:MAG: glycine cleavage system aminomethyltransferase GcvT [Candidatus Bathyarchaeota archaeon]|nr:MAG: glycine cleavage system aminomethyltransferase GcvT [Candidatus Bathyarchaeota archaeon]